MPAPPTGINQYKLGVAAQQSGNVSEAIDRYQSAIHLDPSLRMANAKLADLYRMRGNYPQAAIQYRTASRLDPYEEANQYYLGVCEQLLSHFRSAAGAYLQALNLQPQDTRAMTNLGVVYLALGQPQAAGAILQRASVLDPKSASVWLNYGVSLDAAGRLAGAEGAYRHALELQSGLTTALIDLATNLIAQRKADEAVAACEQLLLRTDSAIARARYGQALQLRGDDDSAAKQFDAALERDGRSPIALTAKGFFLIHLYRKGMEIDEAQRGAALALWQQSVALDANQPSARAAMEKWKTSQLTGDH